MVVLVVMLVPVHRCDVSIDLSVCPNEHVSDLSVLVMCSGISQSFNHFRHCTWLVHVDDLVPMYSGTTPGLSASRLTLQNVCMGLLLVIRVQTRSRILSTVLTVWPNHYVSDMSALVAGLWVLLTSDYYRHWIRPVHTRLPTEIIYT